MSKRNRKKEKLIKELSQYPLIERACRKTGVARATYYRWCETDRAFYFRSEAAKAKGRDKMNDFVESKLLENIRNGHQGAIQYYLTHHSKDYKANVISWQERMKRLKEEEIKKNQEIMKMLDMDEAITMLGGDPGTIGLAIKTAISGEYGKLIRQLLETDV